DGAPAHVGGLAVILVHDHGNVRVGFDRGLDQVFQEAFAGVFAGAGRCLHDHRAVGLGSGLHDGVDLLPGVDVEGGDPVTVLGRVIEKLTHGNQGHGWTSR